MAGNAGAPDDRLHPDAPKVGGSDPMEEQLLKKGKKKKGDTCLMALVGILVGKMFNASLYLFGYSQPFVLL